MTKHLADWIKDHPEEARRIEERWKYARESVARGAINYKPAS